VCLDNSAVPTDSDIEPARKCGFCMGACKRALIASTTRTFLLTPYPPPPHSQDEPARREFHPQPEPRQPQALTLPFPRSLAHSNCPVSGI
jgi:hypothetical protein